VKTIPAWHSAGHCGRRRKPCREGVLREHDKFNDRVTFAWHGRRNKTENMSFGVSARSQSSTKSNRNGFVAGWLAQVRQEHTSGTQDGRNGIDCSGSEDFLLVLPGPRVGYFSPTRYTGRSARYRFRRFNSHEMHFKIRPGMPRLWQSRTRVISTPPSLQHTRPRRLAVTN
jgi:hypothetical protein